jgi:hypothetical protein
MDKLVEQKIIALYWTLEKMYWQERLQEVIEQLDAEILAEHAAQHLAVPSERGFILVNTTTGS